MNLEKEPFVETDVSSLAVILVRENELLRLVIIYDWGGGSREWWRSVNIREFTILYVAHYDDPWRLGHQCDIGDNHVVAHSTTTPLLKVG